MNSIIDIVKNDDLKELKNNLKFSNVNSKDKDGNSLLHIAVFNNNPDIVRFLVVNASNINSKNEEGNTPLHFSIFWNYIGLFKYLLRNGADYNIVNNDLESAFMLALRLGRQEMIDILLTFDVDLSLTNKFNENCVFYLINQLIH